MLAYLVFSAMVGTVAMIVSLLIPGGGFWLAAQWYMIGAWSGFFALQALTLILRATRKPARSPMLPFAG